MQARATQVLPSIPCKPILVTMSRNSSASRTLLAGLAWLLGGSLLVLLAWTMPFNLKSVTLPLLKRAGEGTLSVAQVGRQCVQSEKSGPALLLLQASQTLKDPEAAELERSLSRLTSQQGPLVAWGGWDPFIDPLFNLRKGDAAQGNSALLTVFITEDARRNLRTYLGQSRSMGVQALLKLREAEHTGRFVPANRPGGQALESMELLTALLLQSEHLSPALQRELRELTDTALSHNGLGELEGFFADLLSLSKRLNWMQLCELLRRTDDTKTMGEYAHLARVAPEDFALIYAAALFSSADRVAAYLLEYGKAGLDDLRTAMTHGQGATSLLLERHLPLNRGTAPDLGEIATLGVLHPHLALALRWLCFLLGAFGVLKGIDRMLFTDLSLSGSAMPHLKAGVLAVLIAGLFAAGTEPFLLRGDHVSEFKLRFLIPALASSPATTTADTNTLSTMDTTTLLSIAFFAALQVGMYLFCLAKIREIDRKNLPPQVKLELMQNEENLFDGGLYIGIGGTATALVLQVLQLIEPNLLAAYSSNLFGITCVAMVKIRHVRPYKTALILAIQRELPATVSLSSAQQPKQA